MTEALAVNLEAPCWLFQGAKRKGYGYMRVKSYGWGAHRYMWTMMRGPIPEGMHVHHLCRVRHCVNPQHMELVTPHDHCYKPDSLAGRFAIRTHCVNGHEFTVANTLLYRGYRCCRQCHRERELKRYHQRREAKRV